MARVLIAGYLTAKRLKIFQSWLTTHGAEVLKPTSQWELIRFSSEKGFSIIYRNTKGVASFTGDAQEAWEAYLSGHPWRAMPRQDKDVGDSRIATIRDRDGNNCFFCLEQVSKGDASLEHLVSRTHAGPNHISNLFLAHKLCNSRANHLSAVEKIQLHVAAHLKKAKDVPKI